MFKAVVEEGRDGFNMELVLDDISNFSEIVGNIVGVGEVGDFGDAAVGVAKLL